MRYGPAVEPAEVTRLRTEMGMNQATFGALLGVSCGQVSRWETQARPISAFYDALLTAFAAIPDRAEAGQAAARLLATQGVARALYATLRRAYGDARVLATAGPVAAKTAPRAPDSPRAQPRHSRKQAAISKRGFAAADKPRG